MARLSLALVSGRGMEEIEFENDRYVYLNYSKITMDNIGDYLKQDEE